MNYTENVMEQPTHEQTVDIRHSSPPTERQGTRLYHGIQMKEKYYWLFLFDVGSHCKITIPTLHSIGEFILEGRDNRSHERVGHP